MKKALLIIFLFGLVVVSPAFSQKSGFVETADGKIHYTTYGTGQPFLIVNGGPGLDSEGFAPLAELLSDKYAAILFDQRGTGKSVLKKTDRTTISMDLMLQDMEGLRRHLNIREWIVLGHSFGGWLAEYYAANYPERVKGMILSASGGIDLTLLDYVGANINIRLGETEKASLKYWMDQIRQGDTSYQAKYKKGELLAPAYLYDRKFIPLLAERLAHVNLEINSLVFRNLREMNFDCKDALSGFLKPVLIIQGRQDIVGAEAAYKAHSILQKSTLVFLNECGHYGWLDRKAQYKTEIDTFVASIKNTVPSRR